MSSRAGVILDPGPFSDSGPMSGHSGVRDAAIDEASTAKSNIQGQGGGGMEDLLEYHQARQQAQLAEKLGELRNWQEEQKERLVQQQQQRMALLRAQQEQLQRALAEQRGRQWGAAVNQANPPGPPVISREMRGPVTFDTAPPTVPGQAPLLQRFDSHSLGELLQRAQDDILQEEDDGSDLENAGSVEEDGVYPFPDSEMSDDVGTPTRNGNREQQKYYQSTPTQERTPSPGDMSDCIPPVSPLEARYTNQGGDLADEYPPSTHQHPPSTNEFQHSANQYPPPANEYPPTTNHYRPSSNEYLRTTNQYPPSTNGYPVSTNQHPTSANAYPASTNQNPTSGNEYPVSTNQDLPSTDEYPLSTNQYPSMTNQHPPSANQYHSSTNENPPASPPSEPGGFDDIPVKSGTRPKTFEELLEEKIRLEEGGGSKAAPPRTNPVKPKRTFLKKGQGLARYGRMKLPSLQAPKPKTGSLKLQKTRPDRKTKQNVVKGTSRQSSGDNKVTNTAALTGKDPFKRPIGRAPVSIIKEKLPAPKDRGPPPGGASQTIQPPSLDASPVDVKSTSMMQAEKRKQVKGTSRQSSGDNKVTNTAALTGKDPFKRPIGRAPVSIIKEKLPAPKDRGPPPGGASQTIQPPSLDASPVDVKSTSMMQAEKRKQFDEESLAEFEMLEQAAEDNASFSSDNSLVVGVMQRAKLRAKMLETSPFGGKGLPTLHSVSTVGDEEEPLRRPGEGHRIARSPTESLNSVPDTSSDSSDLDRTLKNEGARSHSSSTRRKITRGRSTNEDVDNFDGFDFSEQSSRGKLDSRRGGSEGIRFGNSPEEEGDSGEDSEGSVDGFVTVIPNRLQRKLDELHGNGRTREDSSRRLGRGMNGQQTESLSEVTTQDRNENHSKEGTRSLTGDRWSGNQSESSGSPIGQSEGRTPNTHDEQRGNGQSSGSVLLKGDVQLDGNHRTNMNHGRTPGDHNTDHDRRASESIERGDSAEESSDAEEEKSPKVQPGPAGYEFEDDETWGDFSADLSDSSSESINEEQTGGLSKETGNVKPRSVLDHGIREASASGERDSMTPPPSHLVAKLFPQLKPKEKSHPDQTVKAALQASKDRPPGDGLQAKIFKDKLTELENEIERFRKENTALSKLREERERGFEAFKKEVAEFEQQKSAELNQIEGYREKETKKLRKEKKIFEKHQKTVRSLPDKKDREEIEKLRSQLTELQEELTRREARWSANTRRMKTRVDGLTDENRQLREEMEDMRAKEKEGVAKADRKKAASRIKALREASRPKSLIPEVKPASFAPLPSNLPSHPEEEPVESKPQRRKGKSVRICSVQGKDISSDSESSSDDDATPAPRQAPGDQSRYPAAPPSSGSRGVDPGPQQRPERDVNESEEQIHHPDGKVEVVHSDGSRLITFKNGTRKEISRDGQTITVTFFNGDTRQIYPDQRVVYYYAETQIAHTTYQDGLEIINFPNNQTEKHYPDGTKEITFPDQTIKYLYQNGGEECVFPDGTVLRVDKTGDRTMEFPNGQREIHTVQFKKREYPDGTVKTIYPDGRQETRYSHGRIRVKDKDGRVLVDQQT